MEQAKAEAPLVEEGLLPDSLTLSDGGLEADFKDFEKVKYFAAILQKYLIRNGKMQLSFRDSAMTTPDTSYETDLWQPVTFKALERVRQPCPPHTKALMSQLHQCREAVAWPRQRAFLYKGASLSGTHSRLTDLVLFMTQASSRQRLLKAWLLRFKVLAHVKPWLPFLIGSAVQQQQLGHVKLAALGSKLQWGAASSSWALGHFSHTDRSPFERLLTSRRKLKCHTLLML